jgi:hypothetical protein
MSMSFYTYRELADGAEFFTGPNLSNRNARLVLLSLGYGAEHFNDSGVPEPFKPCELKGRLPLALAVGGTLPDHGTPTTETGRITDCGLPAGYFRRACQRILPVCEQAERWGSRVLGG